MKEQERIFFTKIIIMEVEYHNVLFAKDIMYFLDGLIPYKRMLYYLKKWSRIGFWKYGVSITTGWIERTDFSPTYKKLYLQIMRDYYGWD